MYLMAQIIGLVAFSFSLIAYHKNSKKIILSNLIVSNILNFIYYFMLGAVSGSMTKLLAILRDYFILEKCKHKKLTNVLYLYIFVFTYLFFMYITYKGVVSIFPFIASIYYLIGIWDADEFRVRKVALISFIPWLIYNICVLSISGLVSNVLSILSAYIAIKHTKKSN